MSIIYRRVELADENEMLLIAEIDMAIPALFDSTFEVNAKTISERLGQLMKCKADDFFEVAVHADGKIVGYHFMNKFKGPHGAMAAEVQTLWVHHDFRKQGIATLLKERGEKWAQDQKLEYISTFVHGKNLSMLALNKNLGFELVGYTLRKSMK